MSRFQVRKVAVLGAGVMGAQIAAHLVNVRVPVVLYDLPAKEGPKNGVVARAIDGDCRNRFEEARACFQRHPTAQHREGRDDNVGVRLIQRGQRDLRRMGILDAFERAQRERTRARRI